MTEIVFFLEEPSAEKMLDGLLPRLLPNGFHHRCVVFDGKSDLENQIEKRMKGYRVPGAKFVILRDKDAGDCKVIKRGLVAKCRAANQAEALVRIACHELESWYLADLAAVENALGVSGISRNQQKNLYRNPDDYPNPAERLRELVPSYQKVGGSRLIGKYLDLDNTRSGSFAVFISGIKKLLN